MCMCRKKLSWIPIQSVSAMAMIDSRNAIVTMAMVRRKRQPPIVGTLLASGAKALVDVPLSDGQAEAAEGDGESDVGGVSHCERLNDEGEREAILVREPPR